MLEDVAFVEVSEEERMWRESVREFCEREVAPLSRKIESEGRIPRELIRKLGEFGLLGLLIPEEYGGQGATFTMACIALEELGRADMSMAVPVFTLVHNGWGFMVWQYAKEELREELWPRAARGELWIGIASTEPQGGSDVAAIRTKMERRGDKWVVSGEKIFISGVREARELGGGFFTLVRTGPLELRHKGITAIFLPFDREGIEITLFEDMGRRGISTGGFKLHNVEIEDKHILGELNRGFYYAMEGFNIARVLLSAACIGAAERALEMTVEWAKQRVLFGTPIAKFEAVGFRIVEDWLRLQMAKMVVYRAAWYLDRFYKSGKKEPPVSVVNKWCAAAKIVGPETAFEVIKNCMLIHGAIAYTTELPLEMALRGVFSYVIGAEGAQNIMRIILTREILGREYVAYK